MKKAFVFLSLSLGALSACTTQPQTGPELFVANCAACHGTDAKGGALVGAPDLTTLSRRYGGNFPAGYVMSTIDGYARDETHGPMPQFGDLLQSEMEVWTDPDGVPTPTPGALLRLAEYLEGVQES